jgi:Zn-dependent peptidase ImmA (M78 family)/transcriptional regulator with XRE-family HTH domain
MEADALAANLRRVRAAQGLTQAELAEAAGLSRVGYRNLETGKSLPRVDTLHALAEALSVPLQDLIVPVRQLRQVRFRSLQRLNTRDAILAEVSTWLEAFNELEGLLGDRIECPDLGSERSGGAKKAAARLRSVLGIDEREPIRDICGRLESKGLKILSTRRSSNDFFGLSVGPGDGGPAVAVNTWERISVERWIFTAAHELGHLALHPGDYDVAEVKEVKSREQEANAFASHFLMPEAVFQQEWEETAGMALVDRVLKVKRIFRVSYKTVLYRLSQIAGGTVNIWGIFQQEYQRRHGRTLLRKDEPEALAADAYQASFPEHSRGREPDELSPHDFREDRLALLVRRGIEGGQVSLSRGAEILGVPLREMRAIANTWVGSL